jgi:hypothetical protein
MGYGASGFQPVNVVTNYLSGRQAADQERAADTQNALGRQTMQLREQDQQMQQQALGAEQQKAFATKLMQAAQYGLQSATPKAFIEQNYPQLAQLAGAKWATADDNTVRSSLQDIIGRLGPEAGIGPAAPRGEGARYKYYNDKNEVVYGSGQAVDGQRAYIGNEGGSVNRSKLMSKEEIAAAGLPAGTVAQISDAGKIDIITKPDAGPGSKPPSEGDKRARVMYRSMQNAEKQLEAVTTSDTSDLGQAILGKISAGKVLQSQDFKRYEAAGLRWAANLLYLKSGATATPDEIRSTYLQFLPQPGDGPEVKAQKDAARAQELAAINEAYSFEAPRSGNVPAPLNAPANVSSEQEYNALPSGTQYVAPDGSIRTKR